MTEEDKIRVFKRANRFLDSLDYKEENAKIFIQGEHYMLKRMRIDLYYCGIKSELKKKIRKKALNT